MPEIQTFKPVTCKHFNVLRSRSNANKKVIDTQCTCVLFSPVFADQNPPPRRSRPHHFLLSLFDSPCPPKLFRPLPIPAPKPRRINTYEISVSVADKELTRSLNPLDATLMKNRGVGGVMVNQLPPACPPWRVFQRSNALTTVELRVE